MENKKNYLKQLEKALKKNLKKRKIFKNKNNKNKIEKYDNSNR